MFNISICADKHAVLNMSNHVNCIFNADNLADDPGLTAWYSKKLKEFDKSKYKDHLTCKDCLGNTLLHAAVYSEK